MTDRPDLLQILRHYQVEVTDGRVEQLCRCPVHSEDRASCSVNSVKGLWNCKACSAQGDAFTLIMLKEGCDFGSAVKHAEKITGTVLGGGPARGPRPGLSGGSRPARGGYRPSFRRPVRRGLSDSSG